MKLVGKCLGVGLSVLMGLSTLSTTALAGPPEKNVALPGDPTYMHLNKYATKTDKPNVYQVTLDIAPPSIETAPPPIYVAIALDPSTSMTRSDIWDSATSTWINRYDAINQAVSACIQQLAASGNPEIYISLRGHTRNSVLTPEPGLQGFEKLFSTGTTLKPKFIRSDPTWVMNNWGAATSPTLWGYSGDNDVGDALIRIHSEFKAGLASGAIPKNASRYVLIMGDGADNSGGLIDPAVNTQRIAMAIKAPLDKNYALGNNTTTAATQVAGLPQATYGGIGARLWTVALGADIGHNSNWQNEFLSPNYETLWDFGMVNVPGVSPTLARGCFGNFNRPEYWLIADSLELPSYPTTNLGNAANGKDYLDYYVSNTGALTTSSSDPRKINVHYSFSLVMDAEPTAAAAAARFPGVATTYGTPHWTANADPLLQVFKNFAQSAVDEAGGGEDITVKDYIGEKFTLYRMAGKPLLDLVTDDDSPAFVQSVSNKGKEITWSLNKLTGGKNYKLIYYVSMDTEGTSSDLWYESNAEAYIQYIRNDGEEVVKYFPMPYVQGVDIPTPTGNPAGMYSSTEVPSSISGGGSGSAFGYMLPEGSFLKPYTPSVTPLSTIKPQAVTEETEEESTVSDAETDSTDSSDDTDTSSSDNDSSDSFTPQVPKTGDSTMIAYALIALLSGIAIALKTRARTNKK